MQPKIEFDIKMATEMLNSGNAEISGTAFYEGKSPIGLKIGDKWFAKPVAFGASNNFVIFAFHVLASNSM